MVAQGGPEATSTIAAISMAVVATTASRVVAVISALLALPGRGSGQLAPWWYSEGVTSGMAR